MPERNPTFAQVVEERLSRRDLLKGVLAGAAVVYLPRVVTKRHVPVPHPSVGLGFAAIPPDTTDAATVPPGYRAEVVAAWGDPVLPGAVPFDPHRQSPEAQARQFGYNCDFVGFMPLPYGSRTPDHGLLVVNHEYTNPELMFGGYRPGAPSRAQADIQLAAHGMTVVEVQSDQDGRWYTRPDGPYNRRITGWTPMEITGPAAGHPLMVTAADPSGRVVLGTLGNCSAGRTPWGTILSGEENFQAYFGRSGGLPAADSRRSIHARYGVADSGTTYGFETAHDRFDVAREPNEAFRFGWVVEVDPYDPTWVPRKRTALGRMRREGATVRVASNRQVVLYSGDDTPFEYIYKFVTYQRYDRNDRTNNRDLLDRGTLYAARFNPDGTGSWLPLVYGRTPITRANGFFNQGDVVINTLRAADVAGATPMDRPEDIKVHPQTGKVYVSLTRNTARGQAGYPLAEPANPRPANAAGHVIEIVERGNNPTSTRFDWNIFLMCGDPGDPTTYFAGYPKEGVSAIACPDNLTFDLAGNLWIATDGQGATLGMNDGLYAVPTEGPERGRVRRFMSGVPGAEIAGPEFTPLGDTLFVSVQHPGEGGTLAQPKSHWPDGRQPPRPAVIAIRAEDGRRVGT